MKKVIFKSYEELPLTLSVPEMAAALGISRAGAYELARTEGLMCGISSGTNVAAAKRLARKLGPGKTVVAILPDTAERYFSTPLFDGK